MKCRSRDSKDDGLKGKAGIVTAEEWIQKKICFKEIGKDMLKNFCLNTNISLVWS